jgi:hypothetical protein
MIKKVKTVKNSLELITVFTLWLGLILGCNNGVGNSNSSQPPPVAISTAKTLTTPIQTPQSTPQIEGKITKQELGADWAFTVDEGILACDGKNGVGAVTFTANSKTYAVNGSAKQTNKYEPIDSIWAEDPSIKGVKKNIGTIIQRGLKLCK